MNLRKEKRLKLSLPGCWIIFSDGGGNRENTIEGLRIALPKLVQDGWKFVTIDELMKYPTKDS